MKPAFFSFLILGAAPTAASSETVCMSAYKMEASLLDWYAEAPVDGSQTETTVIWASEKGGTWTLVQYLQDGQACVLARGTDWSSELGQDLVFAGLPPS